MNVRSVESVVGAAPLASSPGAHAANLDESGTVVCRKEPLPSVARLRIHCPVEARADDWSVESFLQRLRSHDLQTGSERLLLGLEIHDLHGRKMLSIDAAGPLVEVRLQPGTYHVTTRLSGVERGYTIALESGATFDLHLRPVPAAGESPRRA